MDENKFNQEEIQNNVSNSNNDDVSSVSDLDNTLETTNNNKKDDSIWDVLFVVSLLPFIFLIFGGIDCFFNGMEFMGVRGEGGLESAIESMELTFIMLWFIYIPALILLILSIIKKNKR